MMEAETTIGFLSGKFSGYSADEFVRLLLAFTPIGKSLQDQSSRNVNGGFSETVGQGHQKPTSSRNSGNPMF
ncbi:hypothetical protein C5167_008792 [Papaver somniferum]|uniref:Uncharacterized protein n=1 Tax=Papaver somniferum TaxID=3469 RepID=A0A4Y7JVK2_PAPSO|nr:hypothetical protein C5167_008792 [Papaver somniferum]